MRRRERSRGGSVVGDGERDSVYACPAAEPQRFSLRESHAREDQATQSRVDEAGLLGRGGAWACVRDDRDFDSELECGGVGVDSLLRMGSVEPPWVGELGVLVVA